MAHIETLPASNPPYDYLIVGGGTAGCVVASRLSEYLPTKRVLLIEGGPTDIGNDTVLNLRRCVDLIGTELDYDYEIEPQPKGNSHIHMSRAKVLGGCSSHNDCVALRPMEADCRAWEQSGCEGWSFDQFNRLFSKLRTEINVVHQNDRGALATNWIESAAKALDIPMISDMNRTVAQDRNITKGVGFINVAYTPATHARSSASVAYIHPLLQGKVSRPNLQILTSAWVPKINVEKDIITGVDVILKSGECRTLVANEETILCAGAIDTPRLLLLSGIGPKEHLEPLSIPVIKDIPGVGENLQDHPETVIMWELNRPAPVETTMDADAALFLREKPVDALDDDIAADIQMHIYQLPYDTHTSRHGYPSPKNAFSMMPNVARSKSRGRLYLHSSDPQVKPALDFRYFTDPENHDINKLVFGLKAARKIAGQAPFKDWLVKEVAPGLSVQSDEDLAAYAAKVAGTVFHPCGTTKMGDLVSDPLAVVDNQLRVRGLKKLRIADAGIFPLITTVNPMITVLCVAERAAELIATSARLRLECYDKTKRNERKAPRSMI